MTAFNLLNACQWTAVSAGTGSLVVSAAVSGYYTPAGCHSPDVVGGATYCYVARNGTEHEEGYGVYTTSGTTLTRVVLSSSNANAAVNFTSPPTVSMGVALAQNISTAVVTSIAELQALNTDIFKVAYLVSGTYSATPSIQEAQGRSGEFRWLEHDFHTLGAADAQNGIYVLKSYGSTAGAWVRTCPPGFYNVQWFGAVGDGVVDDTAALQSAIALADQNNGGTIFLPQGVYLISTGLTTPKENIRFEGVGCRLSTISSKTATVTPITISKSRCAVVNLWVYSPVVPSTVPIALIRVTSGCTQITLDDLYLTGGGYCVWMDGGSKNILLRNSVALWAYRSSIVYCQDAGDVLIDYCTLDQDWPAGPPAAGGAGDLGPYQLNKAYAVGQFVTLSGRRLQCTVAGTSSMTTAPSLTSVWYGQDIPDGPSTPQLTWRLAAGTADYSALTIESDCEFVTVRNTDMTGSFNHSVVVKNSTGTGTKPDVIRVVDCSSAAVISHAIEISDANNVWVEGNDIRYPTGSGAYGIRLNTAFVGSAIITRNRMAFSGYVRGVSLENAYGGTALVSDNIMINATIGICADVGVSNFIVTNNICSSGGAWSTYGIVVATGGSNFYTIVNNHVQGCTYTITDLGSGTSKITSPNY